MSEVADCTAATSHSSRATQTRGGSAVLRFCSVCVSQSGDRESGVGASVACHNSFVSNSDSSASGTKYQSF